MAPIYVAQPYEIFRPKKKKQRVNGILRNLILSLIGLSCLCLEICQADLKKHLCEQQVVCCG